MKCDVCFRECEIREGASGFCGARTCTDGRIAAGNYGIITSLALDPIEKKPLARFMPGSMILSAGSYGCNLRCPFCQNHEISYGPGVKEMKEEAVYLDPEELAGRAASLVPRGNIGLAFTYNEPLIGWEYVRDAAACSKKLGMKNAVVTNGTASLRVLGEIAPFIDAMNIDLKSFSDECYRSVLGGSRRMVMGFIQEAFSAGIHVEVTTLVVTGMNDSETEIRELASWLASLDGGRGRDIPLHLSRFFPRFHMTDREATDVRLIYRLADVARGILRYVYTGNC